MKADFGRRGGKSLLILQAKVGVQWASTPNASDHFPTGRI
jgi:hypothetical protein